MDGVIYHATRCCRRRRFFRVAAEGRHKVFVSDQQQRAHAHDLRQKLLRMGLDVDESHFYTSALATASFLANQTPQATVFVIGSAGLTHALYDAGLSMNDVNPDYVVLGDTRTYNFELIEHAVHLVHNGAKLIGTNYDLTGPTEKGIVPSVARPDRADEFATKRDAYFVGKPTHHDAEGLKRWA